MIKFHNVTKIFKRGKREILVLENLDFHLERGEFVTIIGRSGSGKSTILDLVMGLAQPNNGIIERTKPDLSIGYVFQRPALLPWRTVAANVGLPLRIAGVPKHKRIPLIQSALHKVGMNYAAHMYPFELSGGMSQRVAIARALVQDPDLLLMDEPFSSLDPILRENLNVNLLRLYQRTRKTILFVTHSIDEAVVLSDRIMILDEGHFLHEFNIEIPRPRGFETFHSPEFVQTIRQIRELLPVQPNLPQTVH